MFSNTTPTEKQKELIDKFLEEDDEEEENKGLTCDYCNKSFSSKQRYKTHQDICIEKYKKEILNLNLIINDLKLNENIILELKIENKLLRESNLGLNSSYKQLLELQNGIQEIAKLSIEQKNDDINNMIKKYVKKQPRKQFECSNVIYILTTSSLQKDRRYILGKAKNLTNRLSTYNKTDEHEVLFFQDCGDDETMNLLEPTVFKKLNEYREQANRERFILPEDKNIDFFIDIIKNCFEFKKGKYF
jgi:hypothetical protein|uniref:C2H2-type domain-containing protein n=1 Tax=viral metagenome TaxID=1070528 RepID=A0A6C0J240_9ZZZZ